MLGTYSCHYDTENLPGYLLKLAYPVLSDGTYFISGETVVRNLISFDYYTFMI